MLEAIITPKTKDFVLPVSLPASYVGKKVHVQFYLADEVIQATPDLPRKKPSDFSVAIFNEEGNLLK